MPACSRAAAAVPGTAGAGSRDKGRESDNDEKGSGNGGRDGENGSGDNSDDKDDDWIECIEFNSLSQSSTPFPPYL